MAAFVLLEMLILRLVAAGALAAEDRTRLIREAMDLLAPIEPSTSGMGDPAKAHRALKGLL
ncbi:hypothetical protein [Humitalea rosea]|uniref:hypothetical protein n=1 Tax=Humitalea rosea TaxID=990373 RepID=UPI0011B45D72|nr:hypothetical protein [Humitalea rosea]